MRGRFCCQLLHHSLMLHNKRNLESHGMLQLVCVQLCQQMPCVLSPTATLGMFIQASPLSKPPSWLILLTIPERHQSLWTTPAQLKPSSWLTDLLALLEHQSSPAATLLAATGRYPQASARSCCPSPPIVSFSMSLLHASLLLMGLASLLSVLG